MSGWQRFSSYVFLLLVVVGGGVSLDALSTPAASPSSQAPAGRSAYQRGRAFIFVVDSLRFETAMDPAMMPHLAALRGVGTFARVTPSNDAVTVPCLRAAFTGVENTKLLGFVTNFLKKRAGVRSVFTDLASDGRRAAAFSDDAFTQFGKEAVDTFSNGDDGPTEVKDQNGTIAEALRVFGSGRYDLVAMHITYTDHVAHEDGVRSPQYRQRFSEADAMIAAIERAVPENDTLVVMGDHGHDDEGRHSFGLDVPTFAIYRGARFRRAVDLGTVPIRDHRYFLGWALGLPLPGDYDGGRHPDALIPTGGSGDYAARATANPGAAAAADSARRTAYAATAADMMTAFVAWTFVTGPLAASPPAGLLVVAWASTVPRFVAPGSLGGALAGIAASLACLGWVVLRGRRGAAVMALSAAVACCWGLGLLFPVIRPAFHEPKYESIALFWILLGVLAAGVSRFKSDARYGAAILAFPLFCFVPTVYRYGSPAAMAPAWIGALLCLLAASRRAMAATAATLAAAILFLVPFVAADSSDYRFDEWVLYPPDKNPIVWIAGAALAKAVLLWRRGDRPTVRVGALIVTTVLVIFERVRLARLEELAAVVVLGYAAWAFRRRRSSDGRATSIWAASQEERLAWIAGMLLAHHALTRVEPEAYLWRDWLLAAVFLSAKAVKDFLPVPAARQGAHAALLFFSLMAAGWVTFAWTVHRLEWGFLYEWFSAPFVERHVGFFLPLILARYVLPLLVARFVLAGEFARDGAYPGRAVSLIAGLKIASLFLLTVGIGSSSSTTEIYLEGAEETAIAGVIAAGLL
jgi:hypothetical protein